jgi:hypothetical protein
MDDTEAEESGLEEEIFSMEEDDDSKAATVRAQSVISSSAVKVSQQPLPPSFASLPQQTSIAWGGNFSPASTPFASPKQGDPFIGMHGSIYSTFLSCKVLQVAFKRLLIFILFFSNRNAIFVQL